jgi:hypothetical protein
MYMTSRRAQHGLLGPFDPRLLQRAKTGSTNPVTAPTQGVHSHQFLATVVYHTSKSM